MQALVRPALVLIAGVIALLGGLALDQGQDLLWAVVTLCAWGVSLLLGLCLAKVSSLSLLWSLGTLVSLNTCAWVGVALGDDPTRALGWQVGSAVIGIVLGGIALWLGRVVSWPTSVAVTTLVTVVGLISGTTGHYVGRVTVDTPKGTDNPAGQDLGDCSVSTVVATRDDKPTTWAALGDSYSAGVGGNVNGSPYGQDFAHAFSWVAAGMLKNPTTNEGINLKLSACSGAVVSDIFSRKVDGRSVPLAPTEIPSTIPEKFWFPLNDALQSLKKATVVTLTLGGNDAGFGNIAKTLHTDHGCGPGGDCQILADGGVANLASDGADRKFKATGPAEWVELKARLVRAYETTLALMPDYGELFVLQYPLAFAKPGRSCGALRAMGARNTGYINAFAAKLGETITAAASEASRTSTRRKVVHVLPWGGEPIGSHTASFGGATRPFATHGLCAKDPWINAFGGTTSGLTVADSFHPSSAGVLAAACYSVRQVYSVQTFYKSEGFRVTDDGRCR